MSNDEFAKEFVPIFLEECGDILADWERHCLALEHDASPQLLSALFRAAHNLKGSARSVGLEEFAKLIHKAEDVITLLRDGKIKVDLPLIQLLLAAQSLLLAWSIQLRENSAFVPFEQRNRLEAELLAFVATIGVKNTEFQAAFGLFENDSAPSAGIEPPKVIPLPAIPLAKLQSEKQNPNEAIRVPTVKIDSLMQLIGELSTQQSTIIHCMKNGKMGDKTCQNSVRIASKLIRELQLQTMGLRLMDLSRLFQRLERAAHDVASGQGKDIRIEVSGTDVEIDKTVIEQMTDALTHMVRNAVDHGIEKQGQREGKNPIASLKLLAFQTAGGVSIEVVDDGRGINTQKVLAKAIEKGLVQSEATLSESKIFDLLFSPGFSTASEVTEVSGRGVGLDVVKQTISRLGGHVVIESVLGQGTRFIINLPTSLSIVDSLIIQSNGLQYVVPIQEISEVIDLRGCSIQTANAQSRTILLRDRAVNIRHLAAHLPLGRVKKAREEVAKQGFDSPEPALIIDFEGQRLGFAIDRIMGQQPIVIRKIASYVAHVPGFSGSTVLANGEPAVILSPKIFAQQYFSTQEAH